MKSFNLTLILSAIGLLFFASCKKDEVEPALGPTQSNFSVGEIYQAEGDGLLSIHYKTNGYGVDTWVKIYLDTNSDPTTLHSEMAITGTSTIAIHKDEYWKIIQGPAGSVTIEFTPFL